MNLPIGKILREFNSYSTDIQILNGGGKLYWLLDMVWCLFKYGARPMDYVRFAFYEKNRFKRNEYLTFLRYMRLLKKLFKGGAKNISGNKVEEYKLFSDFIHRPWMLANNSTSDEDLRNFIDNNAPVFAKPNHGEQGRGAITLHKGDNLDELKQGLQSDDYMIEGLISNCAELAALNKSSLNTLRVVTLIDQDNRPHILGGWLRVGAPGKVIDNWGGGGVGYNVDMASGVIDRPGKDKNNREHIAHPGSGIIMPGFRIPRIEKIREEVLKMAVILPKARYVGWDIAITPDSLELVEMNCPPGHDMMQSFETPIYKKIKELW